MTLSKNTAPVALLLAGSLLLNNPVLAAETSAKLQSKPTVIAEVEIGKSGTRYVDPEFDNETGTIAFEDPSGKLFVGKMDLKTGHFVDHNYQVIGQAAPLQYTLNGAEFGYSQKGTGIYYTGLDAKGFKHHFRYRNGVTTQLDKGDFSVVANYPSKNKADSDCWVFGAFTSPDFMNTTPYPFKAYNEANAEQLSNPDKMAGFTIELIGKGPQFVSGQRVLVTNKKDAASVVQIYLFNVETLQYTQLTFDSGDKDSAGFFKAPEYNNELMFYTLVTGHTAIRVYRKSSTNGQWSVFRTINAPQGQTFSQPQSFVYKNKSFIFPMLRNNTTQNVTVMAYAVNSTLSVQLTNSSFMQRFDPEVVPAGDRFFVYYYDVPTFKFYASTVFIPDTLLNPAK